MMREMVRINQPGMGEITDTVWAEILRSGKTEGVCVVTVLDDRAALVMADRNRAEVRQDIMNDLEHMVPPRVNCRLGNRPLEAAARSRAAAVGGSLDVIIHEGRPMLAPGQGIFVADFVGGMELEIVIMCS